MWADRSQRGCGDARGRLLSLLSLQAGGLPPRFGVPAPLGPDKVYEACKRLLLLAASAPADAAPSPDRASQAARPARRRAGTRPVTPRITATAEADPR